MQDRYSTPATFNSIKDSGGGDRGVPMISGLLSINQLCSIPGHLLLVRHDRVCDLECTADNDCSHSYDEEVDALLIGSIEAESESEKNEYKTHR